MLGSVRKKRKEIQAVIRRSLARLTKKSLVKCFKALCENRKQKSYFHHLANKMFARRTRTWGDNAKRICLRSWAARAKKTVLSATRGLHDAFAGPREIWVRPDTVCESHRKRSPGSMGCGRPLSAGGASEQQVKLFKSVVTRFVGAIGMNKKSFTLSGPSATNASATVLSFETQREGAAYWLDVNRVGMSTVSGLLWSVYMKLLSELHALNIGE